MASVCSVEGCTREGAFEANGLKRDLPLKPSPPGKPPKTIRLCLEHISEGSPPVTPASGPRAARRTAIPPGDDGEDAFEIVEEEDGPSGQWGEEGGSNKVS